MRVGFTKDRKYTFAIFDKNSPLPDYGEAVRIFGKSYIVKQKFFDYDNETVYILVEEV